MDEEDEKAEVLSAGMEGRTPGGIAMTKALADSSKKSKGSKGKGKGKGKEKSRRKVIVLILIINIIQNYKIQRTMKDINVNH